MTDASHFISGRDYRESVELATVLGIEDSSRWNWITSRNLQSLNGHTKDTAVFHWCCEVPSLEVLTAVRTRGLQEFQWPCPYNYPHK